MKKFSNEPPTNQEDVPVLIHTVLATNEYDLMISSIERLINEFSNNKAVIANAPELIRKLMKSYGEHGPAEDLKIISNFLTKFNGHFNIAIITLYLAKFRTRDIFTLSKINPLYNEDQAITDVISTFLLNGTKNVSGYSNIIFNLVDASGNPQKIFDMFYSIDPKNILYFLDALPDNLLSQIDADKIIQLTIDLYNNSSWNLMIFPELAKIIPIKNIIPILHTILHTSDAQWDYEYAGKIIDSFLHNYKELGGEITSEIIDYILTNSPLIATINMDLLKISANDILSFLVSHNISNDTVITVLYENNKIHDSSELNEYILKFRAANVCYTVLVEFKGIVVSNGPFLQAVIEKYGDDALLEKLTRLDGININYKNIKFKYNQLHSKILENNPSMLEEKKTSSIDYLKNMLLSVGGYGDSSFNRRLKFWLGSDLFGKLINISKKPTWQEHQKEAIECIDYIINKKDWLSLEKMIMLGPNPFLLTYKSVKNRSFLDIYQEIKNDLKTIQLLDLVLKTEYHKDFKELTSPNDLISRCAVKATNLAEFAKLINKCEEASELAHNIAISPQLLIMAIFNKGFDISDATNQEFLEVISDLSEEDVLTENKINLYIETAKDINAENKIQIVKVDDLSKNIKILLDYYNRFTNGQSISWKKDSPEYMAIKRVHNDFALIDQYESVKEYFSQAEPKNEIFKRLNIDFPNGFSFKTLNFLDPYAFKVGIDTDCCQRIGGAGEEAAVDSFINPLANVLILYKNDHLISQSYFHYVPKDNGIILDNVEYNKNNMEKYNLSTNMLSKLYADYAATIKSKMPEIKYIKCGLDYNKLSNDMFETVSIKNPDKNEDADPRYFAVDDPYSDFDPEKHLDLLSPNPELMIIKVEARNLSSEKLGQIIKTAFVRKMLLSSLNS